MTIKITSATFSACITSKDGLPTDKLPIIALIGRSNVGKSSLINGLAGRRELARTSSMPGKTLTINFYCINEEFYIVDLPGYGYAKASRVTKQRIQSMMNEFFSECRNLKGVMQVVDIRHKPSPLDIQMHEWLIGQKINNITVLTKTDKLSNQQMQKMRTVIIKDLGLAFALPFSSKSFSGKEEILDSIEKVLSGLEIKNNDSRPRKERKPSGVNTEKTERSLRPVKRSGKTESHGKVTQSGSKMPVGRPNESSPGKTTLQDKQKSPDQEKKSTGQSKRRRWKNKNSAPDKQTKT